MRIPIMENLGEHIFQERELRGMSREELSEKAGISTARLKDIEEDSRPPFAWEVWHLSHSLGLTVSELLGDSLEDQEDYHTDNFDDIIYYSKGWLPLTYIPQSLQDIALNILPKMKRRTQLVEVTVRALGFTDKEMGQVLKDD